MGIGRSCDQELLGPISGDCGIYKMSKYCVFFGKTSLFFAHSYTLNGAATSQGITVIVPFAELFSDRIYLRKEEERPRYLMFKLCLRNTTECCYFLREKEKGEKEEKVLVTGSYLL